MEFAHNFLTIIISDFLFLLNCDIENLEIFSKKLAKLVEFFSQNYPNFFW